MATKMIHAPVPPGPPETVHVPVSAAEWDQARAWALLRRIDLTNIADVLFRIALEVNPLPTGSIACHQCGLTMDLKAARTSTTHRGVLAMHESAPGVQCEGGNRLPCLADPCDAHPHPGNQHQSASKR